MPRLLLVLLGLAALSSCKSKSDSAAKSPPTPEANPAKAEPAAKPRPPIADDRLQALLDAWLEAQNRGDFAAYEKLYAGKFVGVKRVGARTYRFARKGWLADRRRMFKKKMTVEARDRQPFEAGTRSATINFVQRWASGKFEDIGPKRLMVVLEGDELRIAHEEMLRSEVVGAAGDLGGGFYFLHGRDLVLHDAPVPGKHGTPVEVADSGEATSTEASVAEADLDEATRALKGKKVRLDSGCEATVTGFRLVSRVVPHFGYTQEWDCQYQDDDCVKATDAERAAAAFDLGAPQIVAALSGCDGATYATRLDGPTPIEGVAVEDKALETRALAAFAQLGRVVDQDVGDDKGWWKGIEAVSIFKHPESGQVLISVHANTGGMCGELAADHWQLWQLDKDGLVPLGEGSAPKRVIEAVDLDRDGRLELIVEGDDFGTEAALIDTKSMAPLVRYGYVYNDCPC